jgi:hypothetical protein
MTQKKERHEITFKKTVYEMPGMDAVRIRPDVIYDDASPDRLSMDLYYPTGETEGVRLPAVLFVAGFPDPGFESFAGCKLKETAGYISWGKLAAASGMVGITYTNREPVADLDRLLAFVQSHSGSLGIDERRIAVWACSGNVPTELGLLMQKWTIPCKAAVLSYGVMLDPDGSLDIEKAAAQLGFANPCARRSVADLPGDLPLMIVRAGQDAVPGVNASIDHFAAAALARNLPVTIMNHPTAPHSFDLLDASETSREVIRQILGFLRLHLGAGSTQALRKTPATAP